MKAAIENNQKQTNFSEYGTSRLVSSRLFRVRRPADAGPPSSELHRQHVHGAGIARAVLPDAYEALGAAQGQVRPQQALPLPAGLLSVPSRQGPPLRWLITLLCFFGLIILLYALLIRWTRFH